MYHEGQSWLLLFLYMKVVRGTIPFAYIHPRHSSMFFAYYPERTSSFVKVGLLHSNILIKPQDVRTSQSFLHSTYHWCVRALVRKWSIAPLFLGVRLEIVPSSVSKRAVQILDSGHSHFVSNNLSKSMHVLSLGLQFTLSVLKDLPVDASPNSSWENMPLMPVEPFDTL